MIDILGVCQVTCPKILLFLWPIWLPDENHADRSWTAFVWWSHFETTAFSSKAQVDNCNLWSFFWSLDQQCWFSMFCSGLTHLVLAEEDLEVLVAVALDSCEVFKLFFWELCSAQVSRAILGSAGNFQLLLLCTAWSYLWLWNRARLVVAEHPRKVAAKYFRAFQNLTYIAGFSESKMECLIGMQFDDFVMVAADQTNAR